VSAPITIIALPSSVWLEYWKRIAGGHFSVQTRVRHLSSHAGDPRTAASDTTSAGQTRAGRQKVNESARRRSEDLPAASDATARPAHSLTEKVKGPGRDFGLVFGGRIGRGRVAEGLRSSLWASVLVGRRSIALIRPVFGRAGSAPAVVGVFVGRGERLVCGWARVDDVSKRRCQGLVVCRATLPFEGLGARPGVTLAPAGFSALSLAGLAACQSETIRR
jgi:hypothetical protein